ncbi:MAG: hypothetical protein Q3966_09085 [Neisseria sp.]|nr:hypothetical protein [Neisseria sp.]
MNKIIPSALAAIFLTACAMSADRQRETEWEARQQTEKRLHGIKDHTVSPQENTSFDRQIRQNRQQQGY